MTTPDPLAEQAAEAHKRANSDAAAGPLNDEATTPSDDVTGVDDVAGDTRVRGAEVRDGVDSSDGVDARDAEAPTDASASTALRRDRSATRTIDFDDPDRSWDQPGAYTKPLPDDDATLRRRKVLQWAVPIGLVAVASAVRFIGLDHPHELVFDETYYVKDAFTLSQLGYEGKWGDDPNPGFVAGKPDFTTEASYVVHPPLGKWIIALGMKVFGADNGFGWRSATALAGVITVLLTYFLAKRLTRSIVWGGVAGFFVAIDGVAIVMSRVALLDGILAMFLVLGVLFIAIDRPALKAIAKQGHSGLGLLMWNRPWIIAAGVAFGAASAVKWSGAYALAGFGVYLVVTDIIARYQSGARSFALGSLYQGMISFVYLVPAAIITYIVSWSGWLLTSGGWGRDYQGTAIAALWDYHRQVLDFHNGLSTTHPYMSPAWQWPMIIRPTSMYWHDSSGDGSVIQAITPIPNPLIWWVGIIAVFYLLYRFAYKPTWTIPIVLTAVAVTYLPWLAFPQRTIFQFYTVVMVPFLAIALVMAMRQLAGTTKDPSPPTYAWRVVCVAFIGIVTLVSIFFLPLWTGMDVPRWYWQLHMWLPTWV